MRLADKIKLELLKYFRFERSYPVVCTECIHNADINAYKNGKLVEVEIKISKSDFKHEFLESHENRWKTYKHDKYANPHDSLSACGIVPHKYMFCVPIDMKEWALEYLKDKNSSYGLLVYDEKAWTGHTHIVSVKPAKLLHKEELPQCTFTFLCKRMSSELITAKENKQTLQLQNEEMQQINEALIEDNKSLREKLETGN